MENHSSIGLVSFLFELKKMMVGRIYTLHLKLTSERRALQNGLKGLRIEVNNLGFTLKIYSIGGRI